MNRGRKMKRSVIAIILFFLFSAEGGFASDARLYRWENRLDRLKNLRVSPGVKSGTDKNIVQILDKHIKESEKFINILVRAKAGDGSLKAEEREYSITEIEKRVNEKALPVVSLYYLSAMLNSPYNTPVKKSASEGIIKYISGKNSGLNFNPGPEKIETLSIQYLNEAGMGEYEKISRKLLRDILSKTELDLSKTDYVSNDINLEQLIFKNSFDITESYDFTPSGIFNEKYLISAPDWNFTASGIAANDKIYKTMMSFISSGEPAVPDNFEGKGIESFEKIIFTSHRNRLFSSLESGSGTGAKSSNTPLYEIPDFTRLREAVNDLDKYRLSLLRAITGTEGENFIKRVKNNNRGIAGKYLRHFEKVFQREEARIAALKKRNPSLIIYNEEIFAVSKNHFMEIKKDLENYEKLSSSFIEEIVNSGSITVDDYILYHKYRSSRLLEQAEFMQGLAENSEVLSRAGSARVSGICRSAVNRSTGFIREIIKIESVPGEIRAGMNSNTLKEYGEINKEFRKRAGIIAESIRKDYRKYTEAFEERERIVKNRSGDFDIKLGEEEIRITVSYASDCAALAAEMNYTAKALADYKEKYRIMAEGIEKNNYKGYEEYVLNGSLIPAVKNFNPEYIERETEAKSILAKEGEDALAGAAALNTFYRRQGIVISHYPSADEIKNIKGKLNSPVSVEVAAWTMDGNNFRLVDRNAAETLKKMMTRKAWTPGDRGTGGEKVSFSPAGSGESYSAFIPAGWRQQSSEDLIFDSPDNLGTIEIYAVKKGDKNPGSFPGEWLRERGLSMVQQRWGKKGSCDYHWSVSKTRGDNVAEVYILKENDCIIIICGKASPERYRYLSGHIEEVLNSLQREKSLNAAAFKR